MDRSQLFKVIQPAGDGRARLAPARPRDPEVTATRALTMRQDGRADRPMTTQFSLPRRATGQIRASLWSSALLAARARAVGERGTLTVTNFVAPQL